MNQSNFNTLNKLARIFQFQFNRILIYKKHLLNNLNELENEMKRFLICIMGKIKSYQYLQLNLNKIQINNSNLNEKKYSFDI